MLLQKKKEKTWSSADPENCKRYSQIINAKTAPTSPLPLATTSTTSFRDLTCLHLPWHTPFAAVCITTQNQYYRSTLVYLSMSGNTVTFWGMLRIQSERKRNRHTTRDGGLKKAASQSLLLFPMQLCQTLLLQECVRTASAVDCVLTSSRGWGNGLLLTVATTTHFSSLGPKETPCCQTSWIECFYKYRLKQTWHVGFNGYGLWYLNPKYWCRGSLLRSPWLWQKQVQEVKKSTYSWSGYSNFSVNS